MSARWIFCRRTALGQSTVEEEYHYTVDEVLEAVNRNGVIYGINCETISDMVEKGIQSVAYGSEHAGYKRL